MIVDNFDFYRIKFNLLLKIKFCVKKCMIEIGLPFDLKPSYIAHIVMNFAIIKVYSLE